MRVHSAVFLFSRRGNVLVFLHKCGTRRFLDGFVNSMCDGVIGAASFSQQFWIRHLVSDNRVFTLFSLTFLLNHKSCNLNILVRGKCITIKWIVVHKYKLVSLVAKFSSFLFASVHILLLVNMFCILTLILLLLYPKTRFLHSIQERQARQPTFIYILSAQQRFFFPPSYQHN